MGAQDSLMEVRAEKIRQIREAGESPYLNTFQRKHRAAELSGMYGDAPEGLTEESEETFSLSGRILSLRDFGKSCFAHLQDETGTIQLYFQKNSLAEGQYGNFKNWVDIGDILGVEGTLFRTRTGELTLKVKAFGILCKALRTLPEKFHGLKDVELRYRKRYLDMIMNPPVQDVFRKRARVVRLVRGFFDERGFLEVETPMMHPLAGGAVARPFSTFHNALDQNLYLRIAPELYLKRMLVGGVGKVYELNKNFRNEGLSSRHNPEFTMIEFYEAYANYRDFMSLTEDLVCGILTDLHGKLQIGFQGTELNFSPPWRRLTLEESLLEFGEVSAPDMEDVARLRDVCSRAGIEKVSEKTRGELIVELFEERVEEKLVQPTFITHYPVEVSPLARSCDEKPGFVDRFELMIAGREVANGFSELNDPQEQRERFLQQAEKRRQGDETAQVMDEDFLEALEFGMPPAAGEGIGIDRLVMILTDSPSIRDVIAFPQMRPEPRSP